MKQSKANALVSLALGSLCLLAFTGCNKLEGAVSDWKSDACACKDKACAEKQKTAFDKIENDFRKELNEISDDELNKLDKKLDEANKCLKKFDVRAS